MQDDLYIFSTVGSAATGGYDYDNRWEEGDFIWRAKANSQLRQPLIQWMLHPAGRIFVFTRPAVRKPFTFEGLATAVDHEDLSPVKIRWRITRLTGDSIWRQNYSADEVPPGLSYEAAVLTVVINQYERSAAARHACIAHYGCECAVCGFNFERT